MVELDQNGRTQSSAWRALHTEGILWDGPVAVVDGENQLPLRLIATTQRLAFTKGGEFVLDIPREWLTPPPYMNPDGSVNLMVDAGEGSRPERLRLIARDGRRLAVDLIAALNKFRPSRPERALQIYAPEPDADGAEPTPERGARARSSPLRALPTPDEAQLAALDHDDFPPFDEGPLRAIPIGEDDELATPVYMSERAIPPREADWSLQPIVSMSSRTDRMARRSWAIRLSGLIVLLLVAAAFGSGRIPPLPGRDLTAHIPNTSIDAPFSGDPTAPTAAPALARAETTTPTSEPLPTNAPAPAAEILPTLPPSETAVALGVGGMEEGTETVPADPPTVEPSATATPTPTPSPAATATVAPTDEAPVEPAAVTEASAPDPTAIPSATSQPTAVPTTEPTPAPTLEPTPEPTVAPTSAPTDTATLEPAATVPAVATEPVPPTEINATPEPTAAPTETPLPTATATATATLEPTPTETSTPEPTATATPRPSFPAQDATLAEGELPAQAFTGGEFRYTVESVVRGPRIDALALTPVIGFDWVVILLHAENWSDRNASLAVANLQLLTYGAYGVAGVAPDPVSQVIAQTLSLQPAMGVADSTLMAPGDGQRLALVYLIRPDTTVLHLTTGQTTIDLTPSLGRAINITDPGAEPEQTELMAVEVVQVLDGQSILVETKDGARTRVRYLGVEAPIDDACYANESKVANRELVDGRTVYLERERKNRAPNSRISRDVWIEDADGNLTLVAAELAAQGSVVAAPVEPDVRFAGWIQAAEDGAVFNGFGLWGACGGLQTPVPEPAGNGPSGSESVTIEQAVVAPIGAATR